MEAEQDSSIRKCITCSNVPIELLQKLAAKKHFRRFGRILRVLLRPKSRSCTIEYDDEKDAELAMMEAGVYNGQRFTINRATKSLKKRMKKDPDPDWTPDPEVQAELEAMGSNQYNLRQEGMDVDQMTPKTPRRKERKIKRTWKAEVAKNVKIIDLASASIPAMSAEQVDLLNILKQPAFTAEEKYRVLEARDKLIRLRTKKLMDLMQASRTVGTCPDMCPEKERLMRESQHQVALYEQEVGGRGMNHTLAVKQYSRSSADQEVPLPHELRPVSVLQLTMGYLMYKIMVLCDSPDINFGDWYHFLWDRTRGIRKDITQQELCCQGSVELLEQCARFHIHCSARLAAEDPSVFDQKINTENLTKCLQTLKYMYHDLEVKGEICRNEAEFRSYIILLNLNDGNFMWDVQQLKPDIQKSPQVQFALQVYSALDKNNYVRFFKLVQSTSYLNACILLRYFIQVRLRALSTILKCYSTRNTQFPLTEFKAILAFEDAASTIDFLEYYGLCVNEEKINFILDRKTISMPELPYALDRSINVIESKKLCSVGDVVCGQSLPSKAFENYVPKSSFDEMGYVNIKEFLPDIDAALMQKETRVEKNHEDKFNQQTTNLKHTNLFQSSESRSRSNSPFSADTVDKAVRKIDDKLDSGEKSNQSLQNFSFKPTAMFPDATRNKSIFNVPGTNVPSHSVFGGSNQGAVKPTQLIKPITHQNYPTQPAKGGFHFDLSMKLPQPTLEFHEFGETHKLEDMNLEKLEEERDRIQNKIRMDDQKLIDEENQRLEDERRKIEEERVLAQVREEKRKSDEEAEKKRMALEKRMAQEKQRMVEERKRLEEIKIEERRIEQERQRQVQIMSAVEAVLDEMLTKVEEYNKKVRLGEISENIRRRKVKKVIHRWRSNILVNKRKRKAIDQWPIWVNSISTKDEAIELYQGNQEESLKYMKRYKSGAPFDFEIIKEPIVEKIDLIKLTRNILLTSFAKFNIRMQHDMYWKINVSLPSLQEMRTGLGRLEQMLCDLFQWDNKHGGCLMLQQNKQSTNTMTYCIKKHEFHDSTNGLIFIGDAFTETFYKRIKDKVKNTPRNSPIPIVVILQSELHDESKIYKLIENGHVSDYTIINGRLSDAKFTALIEEALIFLANNLRKPPPLELDTLQSFLHKYLGTEIWRRVASFTKWNRPYKLCLSNPKVAFNLYNEAIDRLQAMIINEDSTHYQDFPDIFNDYLPSTIPSYLPCDYKYFPTFWKNATYREHIKKKLDDLRLPKFETTWPPKDENELEKIIHDFCAKFFDEPLTKLFIVKATILRRFNPEADFRKIKNVLWTDVIEILATEKLKELDFSLRKPFASQTVFNQLIVVYNSGDLKKYREDMWFYLENCYVKKEIDLKQQKIEKSEVAFIDGDFDFDVDKTIADLNSDGLERGEKLSKGKSELREFERLLNDLEESMRIQKKISLKIDETLKLVLDDK